jgi:hypothetical protein
MGQVEMESLPRTTIERPGGPIEITQEDARAMVQALLRFAATAGPPFDEPLIAALDQGWIDEDHVVHAGVWLLTARGDELCLVHRPIQPPGITGHQYVAALHRDERGWAVTGVGRERFRLRR